MKFSFANLLRISCGLLKSACLYTVLIVALLLFVFSEWFLSDQMTYSIPRADFLTIFLVSCVISCAGLLFKINRLPKLIIRILHYTVLLFGITVIFWLADKPIGNTQSRAFTLILTFTVLYVVFTVLSILAKYLIGKLSVTAVPHKIAGAKEKTAKNTANDEEDYHSIL